MSRLRLHRHGDRSQTRRAFTLVEVMIVIVIIAIIAALVVPFVTRYLDDAAESAALANLDAARKAVEIHRTQNGVWPDELTPDLFRNDHLPIMPEGYELLYDNETGVVSLALVDEEE